MAMSAVQFKLMPESPETVLSSITESAKTKIEENGGIFSSSEERPLAFGLKELIISFAYPEEKDSDEIGNIFEQIAGVSSIELLDYRRALG
jgi:translation elongation factor aEF-1 beta